MAFLIGVRHGVVDEELFIEKLARITIAFTCLSSLLK